MSRQRLSEFRAKQLLAAAFDQSYAGVELDAQGNWRPLVAQLKPSQRYVVKVDQAVKGRFKQGLVALDLAANQVADAVGAFVDQGFRYCLVEPYAPHEPTAERYLAIRRGRASDTVLYSARGGVDINDQAAAVTQVEMSPSSASSAEQQLGLTPGTLERLHTLFATSHFTLLELNPLLVINGAPVPLDAATEVDAAAAGLVAGAWTPADLRRPAALSPEEAAVEQLSAHSPASFSLKPLNPCGQIFVLLSGGGASLVITDEFCHLGVGPLLGNYGEYSGNPSESETAAYVRQVLALLRKSPAQNKILIIAGSVANFTDVSTTFKGIIRALDEEKTALRQAGVKVFVRRGGPRATEGLALMRDFLTAADLLGLVAGPELSLAELATTATTIAETAA